MALATHLIAVGAYFTWTTSLFDTQFIPALRPQLPACVAPTHQEVIDAAQRGAC